MSDCLVVLGQTSILFTYAPDCLRRSGLQLCKLTCKPTLNWAVYNTGLQSRSPILS